MKGEREREREHTKWKEARKQGTVVGAADRVPWDLLDSQRF